MVSLEDRASYQQRIESVPQLHNFWRFLNGKTGSLDSPSAEIDERINNFISSLVNQDKAAFETELSKINTRNPVSQNQSPFVNVDILIFSIILGINRYGLDNTWIKKTIGIRNENPTTTTFRNLLQHNYNDLNNLPEVILCYHLVNSPEALTQELLRTTYQGVTERSSTFPGKSDFDNICMLVAYDYIIEQKSYPETVQAKLLSAFDERFLNRIRILSFLLTALLLFGITWTLFKLLQLVPVIADIVENLAWIGSALGGLSIAGSTIPVFRMRVFKATIRMFGYPKQLVDKINSL